MAGQFGTSGWDPAGLIMMVIFALAVAGYYGSYHLISFMNAKHKLPFERGAFRLAAVRGDVRGMELLSRHMGPKFGGPDACDVDGFTPLHAAAVMGCTGRRCSLSGCDARRRHGTVKGISAGPCIHAAPRLEGPLGCHGSWLTLLLTTACL